MRGDDERGPISDFEALNSATAVDVETGFSEVSCTSGSLDGFVTGFSEGYRRSSDNCW
jgi:hypothetical protein